MATKKHASGPIFVVFLLVYIIVLIVFAIQTGMLVNWLFPSSQLLMKVVTVFVFDGMAALYALLDMFYAFRKEQSKQLVQWMWGLSFALSSIATALQMYMASAGRLDFTYDPSTIQFAYALVTVAFVVTVVVCTTILRMEWAATEEGIEPFSWKKQAPAARQSMSGGGMGMNLPRQMPSAGPQGGNPGPRAMSAGPRGGNPPSPLVPSGHPNGNQPDQV